jgi:hypothetical protein
MRRNGTSSRAGLDGDFQGTMALSLNQLQRYPGAGSHVPGVHSDLDARWLEVEAISLSGVF